MEQELEYLIRSARRELKRASGISTTEDDRLEEIRNEEIERMNHFLLQTIGSRTANYLLYTMVWSNGGAAVELKVDDRTFRIRKDADCYLLSIVTRRKERELIRIHAKDAQFKYRLLVAIGSACEIP